MAWIEVEGDEGAEGELAELYAGMVDPDSGRVDAIMQIHSLHPGGLRAHDLLYRESMRSTPTLRKVERELIALVVSRINDCHY
jgi:alkylhydroperoxidase family enzyme